MGKLVYYYKGALGVGETRKEGTSGERCSGWTTMLFIFPSWVFSYPRPMEDPTVPQRAPAERPAPHLTSIVLIKCSPKERTGGDKPCSLPLSRPPSCRSASTGQWAFLNSSFAAPQFPSISLGPDSFRCKQQNWNSNQLLQKGVAEDGK